MLIQPPVEQTPELLRDVGLVVLNIVDGIWRAPKSRGETKLKVSQSQVAESRLGSTLPASNSRKG
jgi:hypothetical protein